MPIQFKGLMPYAPVALGTTDYGAALKKAKAAVKALQTQTSQEETPNAAYYLHKESNNAHFGLVTDDDALPFVAYTQLRQAVQEKLPDIAPHSKIWQTMTAFYETMNQAAHAKAQGAPHSHDKLLVKFHDMDDALKRSFEKRPQNPLADELHELDDAVKAAARTPGERIHYSA